MDPVTWTLDAGYRRLARPFLFRYAGGDPEAVHERLFEVLSHLRLPALPGVRATGPVTVAGIDFAGRVGVAAGLDKNGHAARAWAALGFGFAELGTVTAQPQPGNDKPRLFRLRASEAIINRMGFNNDGAAALAARLCAWGVQRGNRALGLPLGISIGKTKRVPLSRAIEDYLASYELLAPVADYIAINVSSPNTPGLRSLQEADTLRSLSAALVERSRQTAGERPALPIFVKLAPDLTEEAIDEAVGVCEDAGIAGFIATNTTLSREGLAAADRLVGEQAGGLSGAPLTHRALQVVEHLAQRSSLPVIGVGGIMTAGDAARMFDAGAALVQLYTGFIYRGVALTREINRLPSAPGRVER